MADINDIVKEEWKEDTTTLERVRSVMRTTYDGQTADEVAERALVSETTARRHLEDLAETGYIETTVDSESRATLYARSNESLILEQAQDMLEHADSETLFEEVAEMRDKIDEYRRKAGVDDPEDIAWSDTDMDRDELREWKSTRRNLRFAQVALAIDRADDVVTEPKAV